MVEELARAQFAVVALTHASILSLSLGGAVLLAVLQTVAHRRDDVRLSGLVRWWAGLYVVNYVMGIGAGMLLELQFGLGFSGLVDRAGNVVGAVFAVETLTTFVVESTVLAAWTFGFGILPRRVHTALIWVVAGTALLSVFWALMANGFLQRPQGYALRSGQVVLTDPWAVLAGPELWVALGHVGGAAVAVAGFAVAGVSAWWLRRGPSATFEASARVGLLAGGAGTVVALVLGFASFSYLDEVQPAKRAALLARGSDRALLADLLQRYGPGTWTPPAWIVVPFVVMVVAGLSLLVVAVLALSAGEDDLEDPGAPTDAPGVTEPGATALSPAVLTTLVRVAPLPLLAVACGWLVREVGRQPWVVTGVLSTADAVTQRSTVEAATYLAVVAATCLALLALDLRLLTALAVRPPTVGLDPPSSHDPPPPGATLRDARAPAVP